MPRYDEVEVGTELPARTFTITRADLVRYCGASGDFNVIHGMMTMAQTGRAVTDWAGDPGAVRSYSVRFSRPVVVGDSKVLTAAKAVVQLS